MKLVNQTRNLHNNAQSLFKRLPPVREAALDGVIILMVGVVVIAALSLPVLLIQFCFNSWEHALRSNHSNFTDAIGLLCSFVLFYAAVLGVKEIGK